MRLFAILLSFCMTFNVLAASGTISELERELDEYQYAMTVEWDQKDKVVFEKETSAFFARMGAIIADQGLSKDQVLAMAETKMTNKAALETLKLQISLLGDVSSSEELVKVLSENSKEFYSKGASWSADPTTVLLGIGIVAIIAYAVWHSVNYKCTLWDRRWECNTNNYNDSSSTRCGWENYCVRYVKK